jgi:hypothetical protein
MNTRVGSSSVSALSQFWRYLEARHHHPPRAAAVRCHRHPYAPPRRGYR